MGSNIAGGNEFKLGREIIVEPRDKGRNSINKSRNIYRIYKYICRVGNRCPLGGE